MRLPSHFFNGFENLAHPITTGNSAEDMMESDGESEGECEGGDVMQQAEKAAGPLLVGQLQFYIPEYTKLNFSDIELSPTCLTGWLLDPTEDEGREGLSDGPVPKETGLSDDPVPKETGLSDGPVPKETGLSDGPVPKETGLSDDPVPKETGLSDGPVPKETGLSDGPVPKETGLSDGPVPKETGLSDGPVPKETGLSDGPVPKETGLSDDPVTEDALRAVCSDLGMCERDVATALDILRGVREAGALGRPVNDVKKVNRAAGTGVWSCIPPCDDCATMCNNSYRVHGPAERSPVVAVVHAELFLSVCVKY